MTVTSLKGKWHTHMTGCFCFYFPALHRITGAAPIFYPKNVGGGGGTVGILIITWDVS